MTPGGAGRRKGLVVRGLVLAASVIGWGVIVWVWPGLHLGNDAGSRGLQPAVLIAAASIQAAVVVFGLAVGAIVLQVMAKYSWAVVRSVLSWWLVPVLVTAVGAGVVFPLWVSFSPTQSTSTAAFGAFGWSVVAVGAAAWETAQRMNPPSLSARVRRRALTVLSRERGGGKALADIAEVLGQLAADADLAYEEGLRMVGSYAMVLADRARHDSVDEVAVAVRALGERAVSVESPALSSSVVRALCVLGLDQARCPQIFEAARRALAVIAADARKGGQRELGRTALDALASITSSRIAMALPSVGFPAPLKTPQPPPSRSEDGFFPPPVFPSSLPSDTRRPSTMSALPRAERRNLLDRLVRDFGAEDGTITLDDLTVTLSAALLRQADVDGSRLTAQGNQLRWWSDYELLDDTVDTLMALLPSPQPSSTGWPTGWQGHGAFDADVRRLAGLVDGLYEKGKHVPSDLVENALEEIGVRLRAELPPATDLPASRTGWRDLPTLFETGGISAVTAQCLGMLMSSAFTAGFDRRALSTGLRLLASVTASARQGQRESTAAYANALIRFTLDKCLHGLEASSQAGRQRAEAVLICLISECDPLLNATQQQKERVPEIYETAKELELALSWNTPHGRMLDTVIAMLQVRLTAAGWPVDLPSGQRRVHELDDPITPSPARPLPADVLQQAERLFADWIGHAEPRLAAASLVTLWAHAACAANSGSPGEARRIANFLLEHLREYDERYADMPAPLSSPGEEQRPGYQSFDPHLRRLISAAARWCARADPNISPTIPHAAGPRTVRATLRWLASQPHTADWTYRGEENPASRPLITVEMSDHSRRILRDQDLRADDLTWGYYGSGPHDLSTVLLADMLADQRWCRDCLGVIPLAANMIKCISCSNTGSLRGTMQGESDLLTNVIGKLSGDFSLTRLELLRSCNPITPIVAGSLAAAAGGAALAGGVAAAAGAGAATGAAMGAAAAVGVGTAFSGAAGDAAAGGVAGNAVGAATCAVLSRR